MFDLLENWKRTEYAGDLNIEFEGQDVVIMGWVHNRRDMGNLIFIDLRDVKGIVQGCVQSPEQYSTSDKSA